MTISFLPIPSGAAVVTVFRLVARDLRPWTVVTGRGENGATVLIHAVEV